MQAEELTRSVSRGAIARLYFFYGDNSYLIEETIRKISAAIFPSHDPDLDISSFDAQVHDPSEIVQTARTVPFAASRRMVVVRRAHLFNKSQWETFQKYFSKPSARCCLIFTAEKLALPSQLLKAASKNIVAVQFQNPRWDRDIQKVVRSSLKKYGKTMNADALSYFIEYVGGDNQLIANELEKLALYCSTKKTITLGDIEEVLSGKHDATIFNLVDAIGQGDMPKSLSCVNTLMGAGVRAPHILGMIARQIRLLSSAQEGLQRGDTRSQMGKRLNLRHDSIVSKIMQQAKVWPPKALRRAFEETFQTHVLLRSSGAAHKMIIENLVFNLGSIRTQPPA